MGEEDQPDDTMIDKSNEKVSSEEAHGIRSKDGTDAIVEDGDEEDNNEEKNEENDTKSKENPQDIPNPLKDPGDANKFWHRKLNIVDSNDAPDDNVEENKAGDIDESQIEKDGDFEYSGGQADSTQVLGEATEEEAVEIDLPEENETEKDEDKQDVENEIEMVEEKKYEK